MKNFNYRIADYKKTVDPFSLISCVQEVEELEQQLNEHDQFLGELWDALSITNKPSFETVTQIREWFEDTQNQSVLDIVTVLDLKDCEFARVSKEFFKLRNLESLKINANNKRTILPSQLRQFKKLKKIKVEENCLKELTEGG